MRSNIPLPLRDQLDEKHIGNLVGTPTPDQEKNYKQGYLNSLKSFTSAESIYLHLNNILPDCGIESWELEKKEIEKKNEQAKAAYLKLLNEAKQHEAFLNSTIDNCNLAFQEIAKTLEDHGVKLENITDSNAASEYIYHEANQFIKTLQLRLEQKRKSYEEYDNSGFLNRVFGYLVDEKPALGYEIEQLNKTIDYLQNKVNYAHQAYTTNVNAFITCKWIQSDLNEKIQLCGNIRTRLDQRATQEVVKEDLIQTLNSLLDELEAYIPTHTSGRGQRKKELVDVTIADLIKLKQEVANDPRVQIPASAVKEAIVANINYAVSINKEIQSTSWAPAFFQSDKLGRMLDRIKENHKPLFEEVESIRLAKPKPLHINKNH